MAGAETGSDAVPELALRAGTHLNEFEITAVIGQGPFGFVYLAQDRTLNRRVALKEYLPQALCERDAGGVVRVRSERHREIFDVGRKSFMDEARRLAQFDHPSLIKVYRFWEANGTAYLAMPYYEGTTLRDTLRVLPATPAERWLLALLQPLTEALEVLHARGSYHGEISPDTILLLAGSQRPMLLKGATPRVVVTDAPAEPTASVEQGYAPPEQYAAGEKTRRGPATDVYALAAVIHFAITGRPPRPVGAQQPNDPYVPLVLVTAGSYSRAFLAAIDRALLVRPDARTQTMSQLRIELGLGADPFEILGASQRTGLPSRPASQRDPAVPPTIQRLPSGSDRASEAMPFDTPTVAPMPARSPLPSEDSLPLGIPRTLPPFNPESDTGTVIPMPPRVPTPGASTGPPTIQRPAAESAPPDEPVAAPARGARGPSLADRVLAGPAVLGGAIAAGWRRLRGGPRADEKAAAADGTSEPMRFAFSAPTQCEAGSEFSVLFSAYVESMQAAVAQQMRAFGGPSHRNVLDIAPDRGAVWRVGTPFSVRVSGRYFSADLPEASFEWNGSRNDVRFAVSCAKDAPATAVLSLLVAVAGVAVCTLPIEIRIRKGARTALPAAPTTQTVPAPHSVFASYSSKDAHDVTRSLSTLSRWAPRLDIFQDCLDLKANAKFKPALRREIAARDVFLLFWSRNAASSAWVRWEYKTALSAKRKDAILPMPLEDPAIAPPPREFADWHLRDRFLLAGYALSKVAEIAQRADGYDGVKT